ncbi:MAG: hydroxymethylglutaryl-CoA synthase, partial [candidate division Zixibacteria bacterium]|nr:hydroxymethylglutaryl-CoA synthase [candidate division Zixibacteria bacterium]
WGADAPTYERGLGLVEKSVAPWDQDSITLAVQATCRALTRAPFVNPADIGKASVGSESPPYAVKPSATIVAEVIGATPHIWLSGVEFACKAGTQTMIDAIMYVLGQGVSNCMPWALGIGSDTSQGAPSDALEFSAASGAASFIMGRTNIAARLLWACSYDSDTPDFWRREHRHYPEHGGAFTGEPSYFRHTLGASEAMMEEAGMKPSDFDFAVFHQPNAKFPKRAGKVLGFTPEQMETGLKVSKIGNTYSGASPIGLAGVLDIAKPGQKIFMCSYGSGSGSDAFIWETTDELTKAQSYDVSTTDEIIDENVQYVTYGEYLRHRGMIVMGS